MKTINRFASYIMHNARGYKQEKRENFDQKKFIKYLDNMYVSKRKWWRIIYIKEIKISLDTSIPSGKNCWQVSDWITRKK